jgi:hypothetical protein
MVLSKASQQTDMKDTKPGSCNFFVFFPVDRWSRHKIVRRGLHPPKKKGGWSLGSVVETATVPCLFRFFLVEICPQKGNVDVLFRLWGEQKSSF